MKRDFRGGAAQLLRDLDKRIDDLPVAVVEALEDGVVATGCLR
jgi:hypothetical protein